MENFVVPYLDVDDIPDEELIRLHRKYWAFIAAFEYYVKPLIVNPRNVPLDIKNGCFLCEYAYRKQPGVGFKMCSDCPSILKWAPKRGCLGGLFSNWNDFKSSTENALAIATVEMEDEGCSNDSTRNV